MGTSAFDPSATLDLLHSRHPKGLKRTFGGDRNTNLASLRALAGAGSGGSPWAGGLTPDSGWSPIREENFEMRTAATH